MGVISRAIIRSFVLPEYTQALFAQESPIMAEISYTPDLFIAAGAVLPPLCAAAVGLRFYTRLHYGMKLGMDDWLVLPALVSTLLLLISL